MQLASHLIAEAAPIPRAPTLAVSSDNMSKDDPDTTRCSLIKMHVCWIEGERLLGPSDPPSTLAGDARTLSGDGASVCTSS